MMTSQSAIPNYPASRDRPWALITGASSGIGADLASLFAADRYNLVLTARNQAALEQQAAQFASKYSIATEIIVEDLSDPSAPERLVSSLSRKNLSIEFLVNNAGFGSHGNFWEEDPAVQLSMLQVNVMALTHLTRLLLPPMVVRGHGRILNVASTAAFQPGPFMAIYYASKAYVLSLSEALSQETRRSGVTITALCPGPTRTDFQRRANLRESPAFKANALDSMTVARQGYLGMMKGRRIVIPGFNNHLLAAAVRLAPRDWVLRAVAKMNRARK